MSQRIDPEPAYENAHLVARDLLQRIGDLLTDMPAPDSERKIDWADVGSITYVNHLLSEVVDALTY